MPCNIVLWCTKSIVHFPFCEVRNVVVTFCAQSSGILLGFQCPWVGCKQGIGAAPTHPRTLKSWCYSRSYRTNVITTANLARQTNASRYCFWSVISRNSTRFQLFAGFLDSVSIQNCIFSPFLKSNFKTRKFVSANFKQFLDGRRMVSMSIRILFIHRMENGRYFLFTTAVLYLHARNSCP